MSPLIPQHEYAVNTIQEAITGEHLILDGPVTLERMVRWYHMHEYSAEADSTWESPRTHHGNSRNHSYN